MTKRPPYATSLRLSRLCRWILTLGLMKLCILGALVAGYPLPELSLNSGGPEKYAEQRPSSARIAEIAAEKLIKESTEQPTQTPSAPPAPAEARQGDPQGAAAARAAAAARPDGGNRSQSPVTPAAKTASAPEPAPTPAGMPDDSAWWSNILQLKSLPFPRLGLDQATQAAQAATLDAPPPPAVAPARNASPFAPPEQAIPRGQNPDGSPLPPRSTTARPLPAGAAGPLPKEAPSAFVPTNSPPAPRVDAYTPPEDPNRKQQELARREQEVLMLKQQMEQRLEELQNAEKKVQDMLREAKDVEGKKINGLIAMYTNMKPKQAAKAIESLDERVAVKILTGMSPKQAGDILSYADPLKTAKLTELLSRMRIGQ